jgi:hypothetical protein
VSLPAYRRLDPRWSRAQDALVALWNRMGPDAALGALRDLELGDGQDEDAATRESG